MKDFKTGKIIPVLLAGIILAGVNGCGKKTGEGLNISTAPESAVPSELPVLPQNEIYRVNNPVNVFTPAPEVVPAAAEKTEAAEVPKPAGAAAQTLWAPRKSASPAPQQRPAFVGD